MNRTLERRPDMQTGEQPLDVHHIDAADLHGHKQDMGNPEEGLTHHNGSITDSSAIEPPHELDNANVDTDLHQRHFQQATPALPHLEQHHGPADNRPPHSENRAHQPSLAGHPEAIRTPPDPYEQEYREFMDTIASEYSPNEITGGNLINPILAMAIGAKIAQVAATPLHSLALMGIVPVVSAGVNLASQKILGSFRESAGRFLVKMNSFSNRGFFLFKWMDKIVNPFSRRLTNSLILNDGQIDRVLRYTHDQNSLSQLAALHNDRLENLLDIATHAHVLVKTVENSSPAAGVNFGDYQGQFERYRQAADMAPNLYSRLVQRRQQDRDWYRAGIRREMPNRVNKVDKRLWRKAALIGEPVGNLWPASLAYAAIQIISGKAFIVAQNVAKDIGDKVGGGLNWLNTQVYNWWTGQAIPWVESVKKSLEGWLSSFGQSVNTEAARGAAQPGNMTMAESVEIHPQDIANFLQNE
ncbi:MAG: hypothetical protein EPN88_15655 [Bacteroidetes bacterium]|nr:MAG: hypothetical protein EPN88_15655 [Bacteroidota bacterium]